MIKKPEDLDFTITIKTAFSKDPYFFELFQKQKENISKYKKIIPGPYNPISKNLFDK